MKAFDTNSLPSPEFGRLEAKLDVLIRLMALSVAPETNSLRDNAARLHRTGMSSTEIAKIYDKPTNTVSVVLSQMKRSATKSKRRIKK
jgi:hypothetical protein